MSHDLRRSNAPTAPQAAARPPMGRPSLFAGAEDGDAPEGDTQRVRLLSTLESTRRPLRQAPSRQQRARRQRQAWQRKALIGLMGAGVLALLGSFVLVVRDGHAPNAEARVQAANTSPTRTPQPTPPSPASATAQANPLATLAALAPAAPQTATIENTAAALPTGATPSPPAPAAASTPGQATTVQGKVPRAPSAPAAPITPITPVATKGSATATPGSARNEPAEAAPKSQPTAKASKPKPQDDDVALLEAMFAHAGTRRPGPGAPAAGEAGVDEQLRRCKALAGAEAATCRAQVCVQHPKAEACHRD